MNVSGKNPFAFPWGIFGLGQGYKALTQGIGNRALGPNPQEFGSARVSATGLSVSRCNATTSESQAVPGRSPSGNLILTLVDLTLCGVERAEVRGSRGTIT